MLVAVLWAAEEAAETMLLLSGSALSAMAASPFLNCPRNIDTAMSLYRTETDNVPRVPFFFGRRQSGPFGHMLKERERDHIHQVKTMYQPPRQAETSD